MHASLLSKSRPGATVKEKDRKTEHIEENVAAIDADQVDGLGYEVGDGFLGAEIRC